MTEEDRIRFAEAVYALGEVFNEPISAVRVEGYFDALRDLEIDDVNRAVRRALKDCRFFPKPVELRELVLGNSDGHADAAWGEVVREVRRVGYMGTPAFSDARTMRVIREIWGSWSRLCQTLPGSGPELVGWVKQFKTSFQSLDRLDKALLTPATIHPRISSFISSETKRLDGNVPTADVPARRKRS